MVRQAHHDSRPINSKTKARRHLEPVEGRAKALRIMVRQAHHDSRPINSKTKARCHPEPVEGRAKPYAIWFDKLTMTAARLIPENKSALSS
jgi:hypothetical protein